MLRYTTDRPGLVALYDIRPGNGVGQFLQPRSPHGAYQACQKSIPLKNFANFSRTIERWHKIVYNCIYWLRIQLSVNIKSFITLSTELTKFFCF